MKGVVLLCLIVVTHSLSCYNNQDNSITLSEQNSCYNDMNGHVIYNKQIETVEDVNQYTLTMIKFNSPLTINFKSDVPFLINFDNSCTTDNYLFNINAKNAFSVYDFANPHTLPMTYSFQLESENFGVFRLLPNHQTTVIGTEKFNMSLGLNLSLTRDITFSSGSFLLYIYDSASIGYQFTTKITTIYDYTFQKPKQIMCKRGFLTRFGYNEKKSVEEDCSCKLSLDKVNWNYPDCELYLNYFDIYLKCTFEVINNYEVNTLIFNECLEGEIPTVTIKDNKVLSVKQLGWLNYKYGIYFNGTGTFNFEEVSGNSFFIFETINSVINLKKFVDNEPLNDFIIVTNQEITGDIVSKITKYCEGKFKRYFALGVNSLTPCQCKYNSSIGDIYDRYDCLVDSAYRDLVIPFSYTQTMKSNTRWRSINLQYDFIIKGTGSLAAKEMEITHSGSFEIPITLDKIKVPDNDKVVIFDTINTNVVIETLITNNALFIAKSKPTVESGVLAAQCGGYYRYYNGDNPMCDCIYENERFYKRDCYEVSYIKKEYIYNLITSTYTNPNLATYFANLSTKSASMNIGGLGELMIKTCDFKGITVDITIPLSCEKMYVTETTKMNSKEKVTITKLLLSNTKHINKGTIITMSNYKLLTITSAEGDECFDVISSSEELPDSLLEEQKFSFLANKHLLRYCPQEQMNDIVICNMTGTEFLKGDSFTEIYCPCFTANCLIYMRNEKIDLTGVDTSYVNTFVLENDNKNVTLDIEMYLYVLEIRGNNMKIDINSVQLDEIMEINITGNNTQIVINSEQPNEDSLIQKIFTTGNQNLITINTILTIDTMTPSQSTTIVSGDFSIAITELALTNQVIVFQGVNIKTSGKISVNEFDIDVYKTEIEKTILSIQTTISLSNVQMNEVELTGNNIVFIFENTSSVIHSIVSSKDYSLIANTICTIGTLSTSPTISVSSQLNLLSTDVSIKELIIKTGGSIYIPITTKTLTLKKITLVSRISNIEVFQIEPSDTETLSLTLETNYDISIPIETPLIMFKTLKRKITGITPICSNYIVITRFSKDEKTICKELNLYDRTCVYEDNNYYTDGDVDFSCPCSSHDSNCLIQFTSSAQHFEFTDSFSPTLFELKSNTKITNVNNKQFILKTTTSSVQIDGTNSVIQIESKTLNEIQVDFTKYFVFSSNTLGFSRKKLSGRKGVQQTISFEVDQGCLFEIFSESGTKCLKCKDGMFIINGDCLHSTIDHCISSSFVNEREFCEVCEVTYYSDFGICKKCPDNCKRCTSTSCLKCEDGTEARGNECIQVEESTHCDLYANQFCVKCDKSFYFNLNRQECIKCDVSCGHCSTQSETCDICNIDERYTRTSNDVTKCTQMTSAISVTNDNAIECGNGFYLDDGICKECSSKYEGCDLCDAQECLSCANVNHLIENKKKCVEDINCVNKSHFKCIECQNNYFIKEGVCVKYPDNCKYCNAIKCLECEKEFHLSPGGICQNVTNELCSYDSPYGCQRCSFGYYLNDLICDKCDETCKSCDKHAEVCTQCDSTVYSLEDDKCVPKESQNCTAFIPSGSGCAVCYYGYFKVNATCHKCSLNCSDCISNENNCFECGQGYYKSTKYNKCILLGDSPDCTTTNEHGCTKCNPHFYINTNNECDQCGLDCYSCLSNEKCTSCDDTFVLKNHMCVYYLTIENCIESLNSKCVKCNKNYRVSYSGDYCEYVLNIGLYIVLPIIVVLIFLTLVVIISTLLVFSILKKIERKQQDEQVTRFLITRSTIKFETEENTPLVVNKKVIPFSSENTEEIKVNEKARELLCVGNKGRSTLKMQFTQQVNEKYDIQIYPQLVTVKKGEAIEFEIVIKPLCTLKKEDKLVLTYADLRKGETKSIVFTLVINTCLSTRLDPDELIEEKKLGEGSFGVVFKGKFRENVVAIKKMKNKTDDDKKMKEFKNEVDMLDKFRSDYIVHFFGAVFMPSKICMVTEYAKYGSLQDLMNQKKSNEIDIDMKIKFMLDAAKGIEYLHNNGILHRDIKPDNILIVSLDEGMAVNGKLTDFGSSRNINMLMTNMTFTKGVGTPKYMAEEVLNKKKYKKPADIFSFAITMYECIGWCDAYPQDKYKYPWNIADLISSGKRLAKPDFIAAKYFTIITQCWCERTDLRLTASQLVAGFAKLCKELN
ncbi:protein serine/threonine kinase, putative [Entamoeba invadens IP1]|uniref:Protein serine/threonine kinase, putative n=1 Tax=Entamoeba invadens IP1 TaxID=370355 RepID=A0A0A1UBN1_ENTIV|nr:protein serine/threonine kinase, putative [Entamoeba invadens IP1]ELP92620.1 protein serine/threonine kinase, putative [Entamoeba invadens IP1]|eukprot:XP_004259391.1 protein serine/threonine kinase, putative [Entamoeba invadens IP1]